MHRDVTDLPDGLFGCDMAWGGSTIGELCPASCDLCDDGGDVEGCMDDSACNYNSDATVDDGNRGIIGD